MSEPSIDTATSAPRAISDDVILDVEHVVQEFPVRSSRGPTRVVHAVSDVSLQVFAGETVGIVGETGCGKSTLARTIMQRPKAKAGRVTFLGTDLVPLTGPTLQQARRGLQMVFQDPYSSMDPRWRVEDLVGEPMMLQKSVDRSERQRRVNELLELVGLDPLVIGTRRPRELSGGQCQRVAIARALALSPQLVLLDEAVSSLDVLVQAQVLNLLEQLRAELNLSYMFIAHDLAVVKHLSDRVVVMYLGKICEVAPAESLYLSPRHPYTATLISAIPEPDDADTPLVARPMNLQISGEPPSPLDPPSGCRFRTRCQFAQERCALEEPPMTEIAPRHAVACHFPLAALASGK